MKRFIISAVTIWALICCQSYTGLSQNHKTTKSNTQYQELPTVFVIGEYDNAYTDLMSSQPTTLLEVCDNDMNFAYHKLMGMMKDMEAYGVSSGFDLKGVNAWMHFFWRPDGSIDHIGFYLKPNSKFVSNEKLKKFLEGFSKNYKLNLKYSKKFSHYSSFSFPLIQPESIFDTNKSTVKSQSQKRGS
ncbi:MAG: hypothetical protein IT258_16545 [Saprospiraceae bacterium]|nr:hypothetical protein [Saprospiraceae bacterium]